MSQSIFLQCVGSGLRGLGSGVPLQGLSLRASLRPLGTGLVVDFLIGRSLSCMRRVLNLSWVCNM